MFCDDLIADTYLSKTYDGLDKVYNRIRRAQKFVLSKEFALAADGLVENLPELYKIVPYCRLPYPATWIEWQNDDRPHWNPEGPFDARPIDRDRHQMAPRRVALLLEQIDDSPAYWQAHLFWSLKQKPEGELTEFNVSFGVVVIDTRNGAGDIFDALAGHHLAEFGQKFLARVRAKAPDIHERFMEYIIEDWGGEIRFMVAVLGLLNTKNVVHFSAVDKTVHNAKRAKQKKPPLFSHTLLKIRPQLVARYMGVGTGGHRDLKLHFVRGHFKHRKTGLFYWSHHSRGDRKHGVIEKDYEVT